jgi:hypothetical protein
MVWRSVFGSSVACCVYSQPTCSLFGPFIEDTFMSSFRSVFRLVVMAGLVTAVLGTSAQAAPVRSRAQQSLWAQFLRSVQRQGRLNLNIARASEHQQLIALQFQARHGQITRAQFRQDRILLLTAARQANFQLISLIQQENFQLHVLGREFHTGQLTLAQVQQQAAQVVHTSQAQQAALIARIQHGLLPATPHS